jgi:hypothetical protein
MKPLPHKWATRMFVREFGADRRRYRRASGSGGRAPLSRASVTCHGVAAVARGRYQCRPRTPVQTDRSQPAGVNGRADGVQDLDQHQDEHESIDEREDRLCAAPIVHSPPQRLAPSSARIVASASKTQLTTETAYSTTPRMLANGCRNSDGFAPASMKWGVLLSGLSMLRPLVRVALRVDQACGRHGMPESCVQRPRNEAVRERTIFAGSSPGLPRRRRTASAARALLAYDHV